MLHITASQPEHIAIGHHNVAHPSVWVVFVIFEDLQVFDSEPACAEHGDGKVTADGPDILADGWCVCVLER